MLEVDPKLLSLRHGKTDTRYYSAADYHEMYRSGKVTPLQVAETLLGFTSNDSDKDSIYKDAWAPTYGSDRLALEAAKASTERYASGKPLSVLDGVPIGVKDDVPVTGYTCHNGMAFKAGEKYFEPKTTTAWPVQKLQEAGAVVIGKNRMHELGSGKSILDILASLESANVNVV